MTLPHERPALPATREEALTLAARGNPNVISAGFTELAFKRMVPVQRKAGGVFLDGHQKEVRGATLCHYGDA